jgi:cytochrome c peroxidase
MQPLDSTLPKPPADHRSRAIRRRFPTRAIALALIVVAIGVCAGAVAYPEQMPDAVGEIVGQLTGANPHPVHLERPAAAPLSAMALLGKQIFFDQRLSASGKLSCASCHSPAHAYGPPNALPVQFGGPAMTLQGDRPPPSLMYLYRQPNFSIGPEAADDDTPANFAQQAAQATSTARVQKSAGAAPAVPAIVPHGGMFWDGRADTLQSQAFGPLMNPVEMANTNENEVVRKLESGAYRNVFLRLFGPDIFKNPHLVLSRILRFTRTRANTITGLKGVCG